MLFHHLFLAIALQYESFFSADSIMVLFVVKWDDIHERVRTMIRSVFDSAATVHPEMHCPFSRSMYGVDVMLDHLFMPKLLEVCFFPFNLPFSPFICQLVMYSMVGWPYLPVLQCFFSIFYFYFKYYHVGNFCKWLVCLGSLNAKQYMPIIERTYLNKMQERTLS